MADAAGIIIGLPGLVTSCVDIYSLVVTSRRIGDDGVLIVTKIAIEQAKFQVWLESVGFLPDQTPSLTLRPVLQKVLRDTLAGVKLALDNLEQIIDKYELSEGGNVIGISFSLPRKAGSQMQKDSSLGTLSNSIFKKNRHSIKRITWAASDLDRCRSLIDDLRGFNEDLRAMSGEMQTASFSTLPSNILPQILDEANLEYLVNAAAERDPDLSRCAAFKLEFLRLRRLHHVHDGPNQIQKTPGNIECKVQISAGRYLATYTDASAVKTKVILESKCAMFYYDDYKAWCYEIASLLAKSPKPEHFRVPDCVGFYPTGEMLTSEQFFFIYKYPDGNNTDPTPVSLTELLTPGAKHLPKPALGSRFSLAASLATSVLLLQACGILHKALQPRNILFFERNEHSIVELTKPLLFGFDYARPHGQDFPSLDDEKPEKRMRFSREQMIVQVRQRTTEYNEDYQFHIHPSYSMYSEYSQRYLKIFDIYSLGVMLYQVSVWKDLLDIAVVESAIVDNYPGIRKNHIRNALLGSLPELAAHMGDIYASVVARCLTGDIANEGMPTEPIIVSSDENEPDEILQRAFKRNIVDQLALCRA